MSAPKNKQDQAVVPGTASPTTACWSCAGPVAAAAPFCATCRAVQPPGPADHFTRLGLPVDFVVDLDLLDRRYFDLQRRLHPDRFATRTAREKVLSQQQATSLNDAYETLKDDLKRADYLIRLRGGTAPAEAARTIDDPALLMESMEARETLAEATSTAEVEALAARARQDIAACVESLAGRFAAGDLDGAGRTATRLKYLRKLAEEVRARRAKLERAG